MSIPLWQLSACELAQRIREGDLGCVEVVEAVLARVRERNPALNAIVDDGSERALEQARAAERALSQGSAEQLGPLHGVPVTIKSNVDVAGEPTPNGLPALRDHVAQADSPVVSNLRAAGAVIIGRTNTPELSMRATTDNPLHGRTFNPWDEAASPGGSSGGAGAAAAAGFGPIHHGNDIGGSLRFPSFACGLATVKPTLGRVPAFLPSAGTERGLLAQLMSVQGAICREVRDVRLATRVMSRGDARDPWWVPVPFDGPAPPRPIEVALTRESYGYPMHAGIDAALDRAAGHLREAGYVVVEVPTPSMGAPARAWMDVAVHEFDHFLAPVAREHGSETIAQVFDWFRDLGDMVDADGYRAGIAARTALLREWSLFLERYPLVLSPFLMRPLYAWNYDVQGREQMHDLFRSAVYSLGVNYMSLPAGVVPIGFVEGLPAGVQLIGRRYREDLILDAMQAIEDRVGVLARELWAREAG